MQLLLGIFWVYNNNLRQEWVNLVILDGIECCIRNIKIIDNNSIGLYTSNEKS